MVDKDWKRAFREEGEVFLNLFFPETCPVCGRPSDGRETSEKACPLCLKGLKEITGPVCIRCGRPVSSPGDFYCGECKNRGWDASASFEQGICLYPYAEVQDGLLELKYKNRREYAEFYGRAAAKRSAELIREVWKADVLIPVPVHALRKNLRGYNQAALIARVMGRELDLPVEEHILIRTKQTTAQKKLDPLERLRNLRGAFACKGDVSGLRRVVLVDDVFTTGSTVESCARVLIAAGIEQVYFVAIGIAASGDTPMTQPRN
ncbi:MAG: ComF family protein [Lachnospiraceae bacterium]|nr:ComF family protein [Lachnospiraceae bacterium]